MKIASVVSPKERKLLLIVGLAAFIFSITGFITYNVKEDLKRNEFYRQQEENRALGRPSFAGPYCFPDRHPPFLLKIVGMAGLTALLLAFSKRYLLSLLSTIGLLGLFTVWFLNTQTNLSYDELGWIRGVNRIFYNAGEFDLAVLILAGALFFWQISIIFRLYIIKKVIP